MILETAVVQASVPVAIIKVAGVLDATDYQDLVDKARQLYRAGSRDLILDFSQLTFMSSSGILSLHDIAIMLRGESSPDIAAEDEDSGAVQTRLHPFQNVKHYEKHLKLLNPQSRVHKTLVTTGFDRLIEIFNDRAAAIESFEMNQGVR